MEENPKLVRLCFMINVQLFCYKITMCYLLWILGFVFFLFCFFKDLSSSSYYGSGDVFEMEKKRLDRMNSFQYTNEKIESYVIDMDSFSPGINKDSVNTNSRITV